MNSSKSKGLSITAVIIILTVYNLVAFLLPFSRAGMFWAGYGFTMVAILLTAFIGFYVLGREGLKSKFYGWTLVSVAWTYLIAQLIVGFIEMILSSVPVQYGIVINAILLSGCLIGLISGNIAEEEIQRIDEKVKEKVFYIKSLKVYVEGMASTVTDEPAKKALKDLAEALRYSDPMSSPQLAAFENKIEAKVAVLGEAVSAGNFTAVKSMCDEIQLLIAERNRKCKLLK